MADFRSCSGREPCMMAKQDPINPTDDAARQLARGILNTTRSARLL